MGDFCRSSLFAAMTLLTSLLVAGCEAPLNLNGVEWQRTQTKMRFDMYQAIASNGDAIVTVSSTGTIIVSDDGGFTWSRNHLAGNPTLIDVAACPDGQFVALDTRRQLWVDTGDDWVSRPIDTMENVLALSCDPNNRVWVTASFSTLLHSADRGESWQMRSFDEDLQFTAIKFVDAQWAVVVGEFGAVMITEDSGETWNPAAYIPNEFYPMDAAFVDRQTGWVVGLNGITWLTNDGAATWQRIDAPSPTPLYGITAANGQVVTVGEGGAVFRWRDQGWAGVPGVPSMLAYLRAVEVLDDSTVLVAGGFGAIMRLDTDDQTVAMVGEGASR